jgi:hypothetical protein
MCGTIAAGSSEFFLNKSAWGWKLKKGCFL